MTSSLLRSLVTSLGLLAALSSTSAADAAAPYPLAATFLTVDSYVVITRPNENPRLEVTGALEGQTEAATHALVFNPAIDPGACERAAIQVMNRPGRLRLEVHGYVNTSVPAEIRSALCRVVRLP